MNQHKALSRRRELWLLFTLAGIQFTHILDFMIMMPLGPQFTALFGITDAQFGLLVSAYTLAAGASGLVASTYIDRFGRKRLLLALYSLFALATLACGLAPGYGALMIARIAAGVFGGVLSALCQTIVGDVIPFERRGRAMGIIMTSFSVSTVAGVPLGLFLAGVIMCQIFVIPKALEALLWFNKWLALDVYVKNYLFADKLEPAAEALVKQKIDEKISGPDKSFVGNMSVESTRIDGTTAYVTLRNGDDGSTNTITLAQAPTVVSALKYLQSKGGVLIQHGFTHQYSNVNNPYNAVSGDDFEFYRARCSSTPNPPYQFVTCVDTSWVRLTGALPGDSQSWAAGRVSSGRQLMINAGLGTPTIFETPHYSATAADYRGMRQVYATRYERELLFGGSIWSGGSSANVFGQFFPYSVNDIYGGTVLPENLGNFESDAYNNNPPRSAAQVVANAAANQVVTESVASFFFHPDYPLTELTAIVSGIKQLGYTFVPAAQL